MTVLLGLLVSGCLAVEGEKITAGDLAVREPALARLPADTPVGYAPAPGAKRILSVAELSRFARRSSVDLSAAREICVVRPLETLSADRVVSAMTTALGRPDARIELLDFSRYPVPRGEIEFRADGLSRPAGVKAPALWRGSVRYAGNRHFRIWARVRISIREKRMVAAEDLPAGRLIAVGQLREEVFDAVPGPAGFAVTFEQAAGHLPRRRIAAGQPLPLGVLAAPNDVAAGELVRVEAASGAARIEIRGKAETSGRAGDTVLVRNLDSGRRFRALVTGRGAVAAGKERMASR